MSTPKNLPSRDFTSFKNREILPYNRESLALLQQSYSDDITHFLTNINCYHLHDINITS